MESAYLSSSARQHVVRDLTLYAETVGRAPVASPTIDVQLCLVADAVEALAVLEC